VAATAFSAADRKAAAWTILTAVALSITVHGATSVVATDRLLTRP
jgi:hypothetical protein